VAQDSTAIRVIDRVAAEPGLLEALGSAHVRARERFWTLHGAPQRLTIDVDVTLIGADRRSNRRPATTRAAMGFTRLEVDYLIEP
jgi:hypothetical protein